MYMGQLFVRFYVVIIDLMLQSATPITIFPLPLQPLSVLGSGFDLSWVTWRHRSRDHLIPHGLFPIGGPFGTKPLQANVTQWLTCP